MPDGNRSYPLEVKLKFVFAPELRGSLEWHSVLEDPNATPPQEQHSGDRRLL
jgi:hypothetical protein